MSLLAVASGECGGGNAQLLSVEIGSDPMTLYIGGRAGQASADASAIVGRAIAVVGD
jgi:hypothetical protein